MIKRERVSKLGLILVLFFSLVCVSASMNISQPFEVYNFGDTIIFSVDVNPTVVTGTFEINLVCNNNSVNVYKISPAEGAFSPNVNQKVNHKIILTKEYIENLSGICHIESFLGKETISTNQFLLTDDITLTAKVDKTEYSPGETVSLTIDAVKANGVLLNGNYAISSSTNLSGKVEKGVATTSYALVGNAPAGKYELVFYVFDSDVNGILNQKKTSVYYEVKQVPTTLEIGLASFEALPNGNYTFSVDLFDQSGIKINGTITAEYVSPKNEKNSLSVESGASGTIDFANNATPGEYTLTASIGELSAEKQFSVKEVQNISVVFLEDLSMVSVTNIGNVPYKENLNVTIGNETETIAVNLDLGEEKRYSLHAPTGIYDVFAQIGGFSATKQMSLTGNAISVGSWSGVGLFESYPLVWIFIAVILIIAGVIVYLKTRSRRTYDYSARVKERAKAEMKDEDLNEISKRAFQKKQFLNLANPIVDSAQSVPTLKGNRDNCSVIAVNVKNYATLGIEARNKVNEIINDAKDKYGVIEFRGQHMLIIYSPLVTKTYKNEILAAKAAWRIKIKLDEYNAKFRDKIHFNIGLNAGEMVCSLSNGKLIYTNLGNGVILAKRISDLADNKLLVSQSFRMKLLRELKTNKTNLIVGNSEVVEVVSMADIDGNKDRFNNIMKRTEFSQRD